MCFGKASQHRRLAIRSADSFDLGLQSQALFLSDGSHLDHGFVAEDRQRSRCQQGGTDRRRIGQREDYTVGLGYRLLRSRDYGDAAGLEGKRLCAVRL